MAKSHFSPKTSWENVAPWYSKLTHKGGQYFHEHVIIPNLKRLTSLSEKDTVLDIACGSGVLGRTLARKATYVGIDISRSLIESAQKQDKNTQHKYIVADVTKSLPTDLPHSFSHIFILLALQNIKDQLALFDQVVSYLAPGAKITIVINHPCFRIPRQSSWGMDPDSKLQYRRINRYLSPLEIPITMHPGKGRHSPVTWSYHHPLNHYTTLLTSHGFTITALEEWTSDKVSEGKAKRMEDRARNEFPMFLALVGKRK